MRAEIKKYRELIRRARRRLENNIAKARKLSKALRRLITLIKRDINQTRKLKNSKRVRSTQQERGNQGILHVRLKK
jgi:hypothetical protein